MFAIFKQKIIKLDIKNKKKLNKAIASIRYKEKIGNILYKIYFN